MFHLERNNNNNKERKEENERIEIYMINLCWGDVLKRPN